MADYALTNGSTSGSGTQQATTTTYVGSLLGVTGATSATRRTKWYDLLIGTNGTPADNYMQFTVDRVSGNSSATSYTPLPLDPADGAAVSTCTVNSSTFGTITSDTTLWYVGINQRASYRWVAAPGSELVMPATSSAGAQLRVLSGGYTGTVTATLLFQEQ